MTQNVSKQPNEAAEAIDQSINCWSWRELLKSINDAADQIFGYNLRNVLKTVNFIMVVIIGVNFITFYSEFGKAKFQWTLIPSLLAGFVALACAFVFVLNA